jgi:hypothetical protein
MPSAMSENNLTSFETLTEHIPTIAEVHSLIRIFTEKESVLPDRILEDEEGLYLMEVTVAGDLEGEKIEYAYMRKGHYPEGETPSTSIHVTHYDETGLPFFGIPVAEYINGSWTRQ